MVINLNVRLSLVVNCFCFAFTMNPTEDVDLSLTVLTIKELLTLCVGQIVLSRVERGSKNAIIDAIMCRGSDGLISAAFQAVNIKLESIATSKKRVRDGNQERRRVVRRLDVLSGSSSWQDDRDVSHFMDLPSGEEIKNCYRAFYDGTSMGAVEMEICGVCAREVNVRSDGVVTMMMSDIPNVHRLVPKNPHREHNLIDGKLFDSMGVVVDETCTKVRICRSCFDDLRKDSEKPPKYSLANNLWIGNVPWCLEILTFPEQLLLARVFPRVYVFKLYPKDAVGGRRDPVTLQRGMKGTVSWIMLVLRL